VPETTRKKTDIDHNNLVHYGTYYGSKMKSKANRAFFSGVTPCQNWFSKKNHTQPFYGPFSGTTQVSGCQERILDFMVLGKINTGRHTEHPAGHHSIRTKQCRPPPSPHIFLQARCPSFRPTNSVKALKAKKNLWG